MKKYEDINTIRTWSIKKAEDAKTEHKKAIENYAKKMV